MENILKIFSFFLLVVALLSCNPQNEQPQKTEQDSIEIALSTSLLINQPTKGTVFKYRQPIIISFSNYLFKPTDSLRVEVNGLHYPFVKIKEGTLELLSDSMKAGSNRIWIRLYNDTIKEGSTVITLLSDKAPTEYTYRVVNAYPHDDRSYTQGLEFYQGMMYEGSGQYGESMLRKYKLETGELIQSYNLPSNVFGEGIVIFNDKIYQLTWQSRIAYEFDRETFKLLRTFEFNTEGWGITKYNNLLVMSDGSNRLYFLNPETFTEFKRLEVYNHIGPVTQLNELEYINGYIYANVYQTDDIVIINPSTGFVEGIIRLSNLLNKTKVKKEHDVLNGIAYDSKNNRLLVTGKYWPEIYHIEIIPKN